MKKSVFVLACFLIFAPPVFARDYDKLSAALAYLKQNVPEIAWVDFEKNNVYIGWRKIPPDFKAINWSSAMIGNRAIGFAVHVWSVEAKQKGWRPGDDPYYCETTARHRKVQDSSCK